MQASRSLLQTAIKLDRAAANQPNGIHKHYPFLNIWPNTQSPIRPRQASASSASSTRSVKMASATGFFGFTPNDRRGKPYELAQHKGKVVLAVNTASKCGFTPQLKGLETVYEDLSKKYPGRFVVIGFPCNQFGGQDPGTDDQIQEFCQVNYGVTFPVLGKIEVNGEHAEPVFEYMKEEKKGVMGLKRASPQPSHVVTPLTMPR
jgi:peroxiredoxin